MDLPLGRLRVKGLFLSFLKNKLSSLQLIVCFSLTPSFFRFLSLYPENPYSPLELYTLFCT